MTHPTTCCSSVSQPTFLLLVIPQRTAGTCFYSCRRHEPLVFYPSRRNPITPESHPKSPPTSLPHPAPQSDSSQSGLSSKPPPTPQQKYSQSAADPYPHESPHAQSPRAPTHTTASSNPQSPLSPAHATPDSHHPNQSPHSSSDIHPARRRHLHKPPHQIPNPLQPILNRIRSYPPNTERLH